MNGYGIVHHHLLFTIDLKGLYDYSPIGIVGSLVICSNLIMLLVTISSELLKKQSSNNFYLFYSH